MAAVARPYAALVTSGCTRYFAWIGSVDLHDLRTGAEVPGRGGEFAEGNYGDLAGCSSTMDQLVLGGDAVSAVHTSEVDGGCTCTVEQIQASDRAGVHTIDSATEPDGSPTVLTNLTLTGDTLTWVHGGAPRSAQLQP